VILVFIYLLKNQILHKFLLYKLLLFILLFPTYNLVSGQSLDYPVFTYKGIFDSTNTDAKVLERFKYLEDNWYCIEDKESFIDELIKTKIENPQNEYLTLLKVYLYINSIRTSEAERLINQLQKKEENYFPGRIYFVKARLEGQKKNTAKAIENTQKAYKVFIEKNKAKSACHALFFLLAKYISINDYESASEIYSRSLLLCENNDYLRGFLVLYYTYGKYSIKYDKNLSKEILEKGYLLSLSDSSFWSANMQVEYLRYLLRYDYSNKFDKLINSTLSLVKDKCFKPLYAILLTFKAHIMSINNDFDSAIYFNKEALKVRSNYHNNVLVSYSYLNIFSNYLQKGDLSYAKIYLDSAKLKIINGNNLFAKRNYLSHVVEYFELQKNSDSLTKAYNMLININKEYFKEQQLILSNKINLKNELNAKLQQEKYELELSKRQNRFVYLSIISALSIIVIIFLVFRIRSINIKFDNLIRGSLIDKKALKEYHRELEQLKTIFKNAPKGFLIIDRSNNIMYFNAAAQKMFRHKGNMDVGDSIFNYIPQYFHDSLDATLNVVYEQKENKELIIDLIDLFQKMRKLSVSISPMLIKKHVESTLFIMTDITESEMAFEKEKQQRRILQTLINSVTESILLMDSNLNINFINNTAASRLGMTADELIGENYLDILPDGLRKIRKENLDKVFLSKEAILFNEDVDSYHSMISYYPNINKAGEIEFIAEFSQDITDRKLASEQINSLRQKVLRSQMNPHFIFNSLNAIQSYVLKNEASLAVKYLNSFARLIRMILDSSRFDYISLTKEIDILKYYLELQQLRFGDKFVYQLEIDDSLDTGSLLIPAMLAQPFIENAIEHGLQHLETKGTVKISFIRKNDSLVFKVIDNGIGRDASLKIQENIKLKSPSLSTQLFKERLHTLNKYSGQKITYNIVDLKDSNGIAKGTMVVINLPLIHKNDLN